MEIFQGDSVRKEFAEIANYSSPVRCAECDAYITVEQEDYIFRRRSTKDDACFQCGAWLEEASVIADIHPSSEHLLNIHNVKDEFWYHATNRSDWMGDLLTDEDDEDGSVPLVHVGTWDAALNIMADKYASSIGLTYLYRVRLSPDAVVDAELYEDENMWPERTSEIGGMANAHRYVNRWEATGSISMIVDPRHLIVDKVTTFFSEDIKTEVMNHHRLRLSLQRSPMAA